MNEKNVKRSLRTAAARVYKHDSPDWERNDLPWRKLRTPYRVFLSEYLLVRTRFDVVARIFEDFVNEFPTIDDIALGSNRKLENFLRPLGLIKRVSQLKEAATQIIESHSGQIPRSYDELIKIKGIGSYTAMAITVFAFGKKRVPADVNILRFMSRFSGLPMGHKTKGSKDLINLLPALSKYQRNFSAERLIDFTTAICKPRRPNCDNCFLTDLCSFPG